MMMHYAFYVNYKGNLRDQKQIGMSSLFFYDLIKGNVVSGAGPFFLLK